MREFELLAKYLRPLAGDNPVGMGLWDDAAYYPQPPGQELVISKDMLLGGVHFFMDDPPDLIARKCLRVNLSDLAAKGAQPLGYMLGLALPQGISEKFIAEFCRGLADDQTHYGLSLWGGDTTRSQSELCISVTIFGTIPKGQRVLRGGAKAGDDIYVTGTLGDAGLGLHALRHQMANPALIGKYHLPQPRLGLVAALLKEGGIHASIDVSDGLWADLGHILGASQLGAKIDLPRIPQSPESKEFINQLGLFWPEALAMGDDYEIVFTAPQAKASAIAAISRNLAIPLSCIGVIQNHLELQIFDDQKNPVAIHHRGYQHRF